ncbi:early nodulin-like protein 18 [Forsythia ovata]|uniref:Early nodulin-like protein 18 n=1 Tax=Forsythia ovata TaxID=205694 RepID=A0ABD1VF20_9LAMI
MGLHNSTDRQSLVFLILYSFLFVVSFSGSVDAYKNYTVGDSLGWYDTIEKPNVDYPKWASSKNFSLGDFLIFNTDNNHSVIQTYNFTTYKLCDYEDALDNDTIQWSSDDPSSTTPHPVSVAVPLIKVGMTYFFSSDYDGLPARLRTPSDGSPAPVSPESGDDESAPETLVPSNFDNPKDTSDDTAEPSQTVPLALGVTSFSECSIVDNSSILN